MRRYTYLIWFSNQYILAYYLQLFNLALLGVVPLGNFSGDIGLIRGKELARGDRGERGEREHRAAGYGRGRNSSALRNVLRATRRRYSDVTVVSCNRHLKTQH